MFFSLNYNFRYSFFWVPNVKTNYCSNPYKRLKGYTLRRIVLMTWAYFITFDKLYYSGNLVLVEEYLVNLILSFIIYVYNVFPYENVYISLSESEIKWNVKKIYCKNIFLLSYFSFIFLSGIHVHTIINICNEITKYKLKSYR